MDLIKSIKISTAGKRLQGTRLRVISENIAHANSLPSGQGDERYCRKQVSFKNTLDRVLDAKKVQIDKIEVAKIDKIEVAKTDKIEVAKKEFNKKYDPQHPAADENGYVAVPNVNLLAEMMNMREA